MRLFAGKLIELLKSERFGEGSFFLVLFGSFVRFSYKLINRQIDPLSHQLVLL